MSCLRLSATLLALAPAVLAGDWTNAGGNAARNGQSSEVGPVAKTLAWSGGRTSIIAWQPVTAGRRVFMVRQTSFIPTGVPTEAPVVCQDLDTGAELWHFDVPYNAGDWTTWIAGCSDGKVYCSRSGNGDSSVAKLYALDQKTGAIAWVSADTEKAGAYDGVVFAPDGDPVVGWQTAIRRFDAATGATVWTAPRQSSVSGESGVAIFGGSVYALDAAVGGHVIKRFDLATGAFLYQSPVMTGFTAQNMPFVGPDGTVYVSRTQNNVVTDFAYAFTDTGSALVQKWSVPVAWSTASEFAVGLDGSPYVLGAGNVLLRLDPATGATTATSVTIQSGGGNVTLRLAVDAAGHVFATNGGGSNGKVFCFTADLQTLWSLSFANVNIGTPCLGQDGTLIVAGTGTDVRAYRTGLPWADVQQGLAGSAAMPPELSATGTLVVGSPVALTLAEAAPGAATALVIGLSQLGLPFKGGTLVPNPDLVLGGFVTDASGGLLLASTWPAGLPSGTPLWFQDWVVDAGGPHGFAASDALKATTP
jgi:hypothetical protein